MKSCLPLLVIILIGSVSPSTLMAQTGGTMSDHSEHEMHMQSGSLVQEVEQHDLAGTDLGPVSTPAPMLMSMHGDWMFMLHGVAFLNAMQQSGPRGADKFFSTN